MLVRERSTILPHLTPREREELLFRIDYPGQPLLEYPPEDKEPEDEEPGEYEAELFAEAAADMYLCD